MSYKALYRTYRPTTFSEVAGQQVVIKTLQNAIEQNKVAHAYLFCGPRGTGKTTIAKIFAKTINCDEHTGCGSCPKCLAINENNHPDIIEIDAASNNGVDEVRELIEKVKYAPLELNYKVYIIDEVHMMTTGAFNALLKTIEEPPAHVIFILATTEPHKVLPTIISRCQRFDFTKLSINDMVAKMEEILQQENKKYDLSALYLIAHLADGGMRDALSILDQCLAFADNELTEDAINKVYRLISTNDKLAFIKNIMEGNNTLVINTINEITANGTDIKRFTIDLIELIKEVLIYEISNNPSLLQLINQDLADELVTFDYDRKVALLEELVNASQKYHLSSNAAVYFEVAILKTIRKPTCEYVSRETLEKQEEIKNRVELIPINPEPVVEVVAPKVEAVIPVITDNYKDEEILGLLVGANKQLRASYEQAFINIEQYLADHKYAKYANILRMLKIVAAGDNYIIFVTLDQIVANQYNEVSKDEVNLELLSKLFNKPLHSFVITSAQEERVKNEFRNRMKNQNLPNPTKLPTLELVRENDQVLTPKERVIELFGEEQVIIK